MTERYYICMAEVIIAQLKSLLCFASRVADTLESLDDAIPPLVAIHPSFLPSFSSLLPPRISSALYLTCLAIRHIRRCAVHKSIIPWTIANNSRSVWLTIECKKWTNMVTLCTRYFRHTYDLAISGKIYHRLRNYISILGLGTLLGRKIHAEPWSTLITKLNFKIGRSQISKILYLFPDL